MGPLLVRGQAGLARVAPARMRSEGADGQHVGIGPVTVARLPDPVGQVVEDVPDAHGESVFGLSVRERPAVPDVVGDAPHLCVLTDFGGVGRLCRARRQAQDDRATGPGDRVGDLADLSGFVGMVRDAIDFDEIQAPACIQRQHGVVIGLAGGVVANTIIAVVPSARVRSVRGVCGMEGRAGDGGVAGDRVLGNAPHDVEAEFQALGVHPLGQRLEAAVTAGGWKAGRHGNQQAVLVEHILPVLQLVAKGVAHVPAFIDHRISPPVGAQLGQLCRVGLEVGLIDGETEGIPAVPAHGRSRSALLGHSSNGETQQEGPQQGGAQWIQHDFLEGASRSVWVVRDQRTWMLRALPTYTASPSAVSTASMPTP